MMERKSKKWRYTLRWLENLEFTPQIRLMKIYELTRNTEDIRNSNKENNVLIKMRERIIEKFNITKQLLWGFWLTPFTLY